MTVEAQSSGGAAPVAVPVWPGVGARVRKLLHGSVENLLATWNEERGLFPGVSRRRGEQVINAYDHPVAVRYTVGSLLGLAQAAHCGRLGVTSEQVQALARTFSKRAGHRLPRPADRGLHVLLQCALGVPRRELAGPAGELTQLLDTRVAALNTQDVTWILWGAAGAAAAGVPAAKDTVRRACAILTAHLADPGTGLPRHTTEWYRRRIVSFGSLTYFLRAMAEAAATLEDGRADALFTSGAAHALRFQGPQGEWPWMIDCRDAKPFDHYPVFGVHQDSMAMLFLHPALDRGMAGSAQAITRSLSWGFGNNALEAQMYPEQPFFFPYRAIERAERMPKLRRYLRSGRLRAGLPPAARTPTLRLNSECRSYHPGWILFAWSNRPEIWDRAQT
jgi:hypothetical protein